MTTLDTCTVKTPIGPIVLLAHDGRLVGVEFADLPDRSDMHGRRLTRYLGACERRTAKDPAGAATRLERYMAGDLAALDEQPCRFHGTPFQHDVWRALRTIPAGETRTYGDLAAEIGRPTAVRAVGAANGANPIALFAPCHRVIAADHTLWGYGGGLDRKRWLLEHERAAFVDRAAQGALPFGARGAAAARAHAP